MQGFSIEKKPPHTALMSVTYWSAFMIDVLCVRDAASYGDWL
ncbi:hypothetical protein [Ralstonia phage phiRSL1]|uniref:Uncharacterized protein n=1 Tax=Ralstonia phage phiRSL1 TaxID=1980924 RepID=B2ZXQ1_9CAUD|nr:hypothetical protein RSL1_ORF031 [Ralstonia phage phiRSL1]BAG41476.1 hypothetical protein [Ralstonia phage phiRSL1]